MANILKKLIDNIMEVDDEPELEYTDSVTDEGYDEGELEAERRQPVSRRNVSAGVTNLPGSNLANLSKLVVFMPVSYEDTQNVIDNLKGHKPIILNLEQIEVDVAQRVLDFISGACYALNGKMQKISARVFIVAPASVAIVSSSGNPRD